MIVYVVVSPVRPAFVSRDSSLEVFRLLSSVFTPPFCFHGSLRHAVDFRGVVLDDLHALELYTVFFFIYQFV